ncbi:MAG TPA: O-antigen ligase family protein [Candidatus Avacidaminococcus intestinavium]|uniref:O-antigen ligase family protein n=1 Tax=Candidatus Avacidaminococcus intestinavium TaxID=2840684 RepID=A0A9D1SL80_9FIRM|nr:O-antigen ligase family protein [Candidatus Avacidaminococcus intestinavium]
MKNAITDLLKMNSEEIVFWLLTLAIFVVPLSQVVSGVLVLSVIGVALVKRVPPAPQQSAASTEVTKITFLTKVLLLLSAVSLVFARDLFASFYNYLYVVGQYVAFFILINRYVTERSKLIILMKVFFLAGLLTSIYGLYQYANDLALIDAEWVDQQEFPELKQRVFATLGNPNILGSFLVMLSSYCLAFISVLGKNKIRYALGLLTFIAACCLVLTFSRGNWVSLFGVLVFFMCIFYRKAQLMLAVIAIMMAIGGWGLFYERFLSIFSSGDTSVALRFAYLESALAIIRDNLLGVGWYGFMSVFHEYDFYLQNQAVPMYHSHNLFTNITAELGLQGLSAFLLLIGYCVRSAWRLQKSTIDPFYQGLARGYLLMILGVFISGFTDHTLFNIQLGVLFWIFHALLLQCLKNTANSGIIDNR